MVIDCHTHIDKAGHKDWTSQQLLTSMSDAGIDISLVISNHVTQAPLDKVLETTKGQDKFRVIGNVEFEHFDKAQLQKLISHLEKKEIVGVKLFPGYENFYPYDKVLFPLFEYLEKNNHPLMIHTGVMLTGFSGFLEQAHPLHVDKIAHAFPKLKIVIAHMGNPWLIDTIAVMWKNPHVYADFSGFFDEFRPISVDEANGFLDRMRQVKYLMGNLKRFLFGTDWPLYSQKEYIDVIKKMPLNDEETQHIFWKNAANIFSLE